jgi:hypothetical protein
MLVKAGHASVEVPQVKPKRSSRRKGRSFVGIAGSLVLTVVLSASAHADTIDQANAQAKHLAVEIGKLQPQVDAALAAYDTSLESIGQAVSSNVAAAAVYKVLQQRADDLANERDGHLVALYEAGGSLAMYAAALQAGRPADLQQLHNFTGIVTADTHAAASARRVAAVAKATLDTSDRQVGSGLDNADVVNQRLLALQNALGAQQALLDQASARAKDLQALKDAAAALAASRAAAAQAGAQAASDVQPYDLPSTFRALYQSAATTCPGLSWTVLAAIGQVETHHGRGTMVSTAGALGPMQFMAPTFVRYATDGDHDGLADIMNPADAIFTAATYLCANGAGNPDSLYSAIWNYNHADWYVQLVLALSTKIS